MHPGSHLYALKVSCTSPIIFETMSIKVLFPLIHVTLSVVQSDLRLTNFHGSRLKVNLKKKHFVLEEISYEKSHSLNLESCQKKKKKKKKEKKKKDVGFVTLRCPNGMYILRFSNQDGVSLLYIILEIHHSGRESLILL